MVRYMNRKILSKMLCLMLIITGLCIYNFTVKGKSDDSVTAEIGDEIGLAEDSPYAILLECSTGKVIYEKNAMTPHPPASMTKIMTMLLVMEAIESEKLKWNSELIASENAVGMGGTQIYLEVGEKMTVEELFKAVAIASANDAAVVLGEAIGGTLDNFIKMMNQKGKELGFKNTNFKNCNGLPEKDHYSCAYDMGKLSCYLLCHYGDTVLKYTSIYEDYLRKGTEDEFWLVNTNKLIKLYPEIDGLKTGYCSDSMYCLTATMRKENVRFISVVMGAKTIEERNSDTLRMLNYAAANYELETIYQKGYIIESVNDITKIPHDYDIIVKDDINILKKKGEELDYQTVIEKDKIKVYLNDEIISESYLITSCEVKNANLFLMIIEMIKRIFIKV